MITTRTYSCCDLLSAEYTVPMAASRVLPQKRDAILQPNLRLEIENRPLPRRLEIVAVTARCTTP